MMYRETVTIPEDRKLRLELDVPETIPCGAACLTLEPVGEAAVFMGASILIEDDGDFFAIQEKLRNLCKDSRLTVEKFLGMKRRDKAREFANDARMMRA